MNTIENIKSEVEIFKSFVRKGEKLFYVDADNCEKWIVTDVAEPHSFTAIDEEGAASTMNFEELQKGWQFSEEKKAKIENMILIADLYKGNSEEYAISSLYASHSRSYSVEQIAIAVKIARQ